MAAWMNGGQSNTRVRTLAKFISPASGFPFRKRLKMRARIRPWNRRMNFRQRRQRKPRLIINLRCPQPRDNPYLLPSWPFRRLRSRRKLITMRCCESRSRLRLKWATRLSRTIRKSNSCSSWSLFIAMCATRLWKKSGILRVFATSAQVQPIRCWVASNTTSTCAATVYAIKWQKFRIVEPAIKGALMKCTFSLWFVMSVKGKRWLRGPADPATTTSASSVSLAVWTHERL